MKILRFLGVLAMMTLGLLVISCEETTDGLDKYSIVGTWELVPDANTPPEDVGLRITFAADGTLKQYEPSTRVTNEGKYTYSNGQLSFTMSEGPIAVSYTVPVKELTANKLVVLAEDEGGHLVPTTYKRIR